MKAECEAAACSQRQAGSSGTSLESWWAWPSHGGRGLPRPEAFNKHLCVLVLSVSGLSLLVSFQFGL